MDTVGIGNAAVRAARSAPAFALDAVADTAAVPERSLREMLGCLRRRGRCDTTAADAAADTDETRRVAGLESRWCPPPLRRLVASNDPAEVRWVCRSTAAWHARRVNDGDEAPRMRAAAAFADPAGRAAAGSVSISSCPPAMLAALASDPDPDVRTVVLGDPSCPPAAVAALAVDDVVAISHKAADNPNCPSVALATLARCDRVWDLGRIWQQRAVARHLNCAPSVLQFLAAGNDLSVRAVASSNPNCPPELLENVVAACGPVVGVAVADHRNCTQAVVHAMARSEHPEVRMKAARHRLCDLSTLQMLAEDNDLAVRDAAGFNPKARQLRAHDTTARHPHTTA